MIEDMSKKEEEYSKANIKEWHWLTNLPGFGYRKLAVLKNAADSVSDLYMLEDSIGHDKGEELLKNIFAGAGVRFDKKDMEVFFDRELKDRLAMKYMELLSSDVNIASIDSEDYPEKLRDIFDAPYILYYRGNLPDSAKKSVAVVGARACSEYGRSMAKEISGQLAVRGVQVISGFARGIDTASHNGSLALDGGRTFAVFGCGINHCYPSENRFTYDEIIEKGGGIISEYPPDMKPSPGFFPMRNRIISGLSDVVIVVEAGIKSGSLITADHALEQGRTVMALPGRVTDRLSEGCNKLIHQGAGIIYCMDDILFELGLSDTQKMSVNLKISQIELAKPEKMLYSHLDFSPQSIDDLVRKSGIGPDEAAACLVRLELAGMAKRIGGMYVRGK